MLQSGATLYVSNSPINDNFELSGESNSLKYFFYIGVPIIVCLIIAILIFLVIKIVKKKLKKAKEIPSTTQKEPIKKQNEINSNPPNNNFIETEDQSSNFHYPINNPPLMPLSLNIPNNPYTNQKQSNNQLPMVYMMPVPLSPIDNIENNTGSRRTVDHKEISKNIKNSPIDNLNHASRMNRKSGFNNSQPVYVVQMPQVDVQENHYNAPQEDLPGNNLKIESLSKIPGEEEVPVFEIDLANVNKYGDQQKFS
jgi:hypothetical protein